LGRRWDARHMIYGENEVRFTKERKID